MSNKNTKYPGIEVQLLGENGNAFFILSRVQRALKAAGISRSERDQYMEDAMSGDYDHLLSVTMNWVTVY